MHVCVYMYGVKTVQRAGKYIVVTAEWAYRAGGDGSM